MLCRSSHPNGLKRKIWAFRTDANDKRLAPALNLGLLSPRELCAAAEAVWRAGRAPLNAVEGFVGQILGWHEYVRGVYWTLVPGYAEANALAATCLLLDE
jgi:deoxyribodipyrimidine photolyase-related protein